MAETLGQILCARTAIVAILLTGCSGSAPGEAPHVPPTAAFSTTTSVATLAPTPTQTTTSTTPTTSSVSSTTTAPSATGPLFTHVTAPGTYATTELVIHLRFESEVPELGSDEFSDTSLAILNDPRGWPKSGFTFVADESSELVVVLADGPRVDQLCLPLETYGLVSCQNGNVVALNVDRWNEAWPNWDSTLDVYRAYLVAHEVGHLLGQRHPAERCPDGQPTSALMDPQTMTNRPCPGNAVPLEWEITWASTRPAVIGPVPDWNGPRPAWGGGS